MSHNHIAHPVKAIQAPGQDGYAVGTDIPTFTQWLTEHATEDAFQGRATVSWCYDAHHGTGHIYFNRKSIQFTAAQWIVKYSNKDFRILDADDFSENYEPTQGEDR